jgi:hypothetical protein
LHTFVLEQTTTTNILTMPLTLELDGGGWLSYIFRDYYDPNNINLSCIEHTLVELARYGALMEGKVGSS